MSPPSGLAVAAARARAPLAVVVVVVVAAVSPWTSFARDGRAVDVDDVAAHLDGVAGERDHALDVVAVRLHGCMNTITSPRAGCGSNSLSSVNGMRSAVDELVDEDVVADLERRIHRARRDLERLDDERAQREREQRRAVTIDIDAIARPATCGGLRAISSSTSASSTGRSRRTRGQIASRRAPSRRRARPRSSRRLAA